MSVARTAPDAIAPADVEGWLAELDLQPLTRVDREQVVSWDLELDGRRRFDLRVTLILDPGLALICWVHLAPPIGDRFRVSYRRLLRWNDEFPFVKFAVAEDERPILAVEIPAARASVDELGLGLARLLALADRLLEETADWLWVGGEIPAGYLERRSRNPSLLERYAGDLGELGQPVEPTEPGGAAT
jgi:putative sensory transduction regulator